MSVDNFMMRHMLAARPLTVSRQFLSLWHVPWQFHDASNVDGTFLGSLYTMPNNTGSRKFVERSEPAVEELFYTFPFISYFQPLHIFRTLEHPVSHTTPKKNCCLVLVKFDTFISCERNKYSLSCIAHVNMASSCLFLSSRLYLYSN